MPSELSRGVGKRVARGDRVAIVAGLRTPFAKQQTAYASLSAYELGCLVVRELCERTAIDRRDIGLVVYGQAVPSPSAPNIAREIVLGAGLPKSIEAFSVVRACATSFQAATSAAESILAGQHDVAIVGGADSASDVPITISPSFDRPIARDNLVRHDSKVDSYANLRPVFDRDHGSVTAGNSSPLTDGASALLLMRSATPPRPPARA